MIIMVQTTLTSRQEMRGSNKDVYRISYVRMFYSTNQDNTPKPFLEIRAFILLDYKPTPKQVALAKDNLEIIINKLEDTMNDNASSKGFERSLEIAKDKIRRESSELGEMLDKVRLKEVKFNINGVEYERTDMDELEMFFKKNKQPTIVKSKQLYRYIAFFDGKKGNLRYDYDEEDIRSWENQLTYSAFRRDANESIQRYAEVVMLTRQLEKSRSEYDILLEKIRKFSKR